MKSFLYALFSICISPLYLPAQNSETYFLSNPCMSPDGQTVIFSFEGDLWKAGIRDGQAARLTAMQGYETSPRVSPDGKWIAFTGRQFGNADIFIMPVNGGEIKQRVDEKGNGRIAYGYMKNMGQGELDKFIIDMTQELGGKDALIFDLRYNTGGNVHDAVLSFLSQRSYLQWKYREGKLTTQPNFSPSDKPIVLLINEQSLSDAEMTANGFKALELGKIIGNETYRWIIFTSGISLVDNSSVRMPSWGCYTLDGKDLEKTGVQPDITVINTFEDKLNGRDPQLDRAIEEVLNQLK